MSQVTINIPTLKNWRTTLLGLLSAAGYAAMTYYQGGGLSWKEAAGCASWASLCYLVGDGKEVNAANEKITSMDLMARANKIDVELGTRENRGLF